MSALESVVDTVLPEIEVLLTEADGQSTDLSAFSAATLRIWDSDESDLVTIGHSTQSENVVSFSSVTMPSEAGLYLADMLVSFTGGEVVHTDLFDVDIREDKP